MDVACHGLTDYLFMTKVNKNTFQETQQFRQKWTYLIYLLLFALFLLFIYAIYQQLILGKLFGDEPAPDFVLVLCAILMILLLVILYNAKLETDISSTSIKIKFSPFQRKFKEFQWESIESAEIINYKFIGYGIRLIPGGKAYNVSGNKGLSLLLRSGKKILIGTQKPRELEDFLRSNRT